MLMAVRPFRVAPDRFEQEGWRGQFARVQRWQQRALRAVESGEQHPEDYVYAFCQNAYHLRDWLQNSGAASQRDLDELMARTPALKLCRDVCNGSKHLVLDQRRTSTDHIGLMREYVPPPVTGGEPGERLRLLAVEGQDGSVNFFEIEDLLEQCVSAWRDFCREIRLGA